MVENEPLLAPETARNETVHKAGGTENIQEDGEDKKKSWYDGENNRETAELTIVVVILDWNDIHANSAP